MFVFKVSEEAEGVVESRARRSRAAGGADMKLKHVCLPTAELRGGGLLHVSREKLIMGCVFSLAPLAGCVLIFFFLVGFRKETLVATNAQLLLC